MSIDLTKYPNDDNIATETSVEKLVALRAQLGVACGRYHEERNELERRIDKLGDRQAERARLLTAIDRRKEELRREEDDHISTGSVLSIDGNPYLASFVNEYPGQGVRKHVLYLVSLRNGNRWRDGHEVDSTSLRLPQLRQALPGCRVDKVGTIDQYSIIKRV